jgi:chromosome segregation ATPase
MNLFKTIIRKFLWFDITPRKELYAELNECYEKVNKYFKDAYELEKKVESLKEELEKYSISNSELKDEVNELLNDNEKLRSVNMDLQRQIWDYEEQIHQMGERLDDLLGVCDIDDETSY